MIDAHEGHLEYPREPESSVAEVGGDAGSLRYDDVVQDGRLRLESAWRPTGRVLWGHPEVAKILKSMGRGVTNVLSRVTMQASEHPLEPRAAVRTTVRYRFEHTVDAEGTPDRILFSTWLDAFARGKDGHEHPAARAYGQRVFTQLHAAPGQHLVTHLAGFGESGIPEHRAVWEPATALLALPRGAEALDPAPRLDPGRVVFGLSHTDLNQHVNFLMYQRAVEQAALARFLELGLGARLLSREVSFGYRKPSFAGDVVRVAVQAFRLRGTLGVIAAVVDDDSGPAERASFRDFGSPRNVAQMLFRP
jgi:hypothetical protein